jgi:prepilin-type N-terminal cleavage/methylation domain-containing protein
MFPRAMSKRRARAFTLIELVIVVAVMALIAAVLVPAVISRLQRSEIEEPPARIAQAPPMLEAHGAGERRSDPRIRAARVKVTLKAQPVLDGLRVQNRYRAVFEGEFVVENVDPSADTISIVFPFPPGTSEAKNVGLFVGGKEPEGVRYGSDGIEWTTAAAVGEALKMVVTYEAVGRDAFTYDVAGQGRTDEIDFEIALENAPEVEVPAESLTPSSIARDRISWKLERAVASRPIVVELPAGTSSLGKLIRLFQLAALGVLLFGAGFWYLAEGSEPGRLDSFRWGHFLLLASNYSLFFAVFAVIVHGGSPLVATATAASISLPLLALHVSRVLDLRFTLRAVMPLAIYSLATVVGAVYAPEHRALVLLGALVVAIGYVTATYRGFVAKRNEHAAAKAQKAKEAAEREKAEAAARALAEAAERAAAKTAAARTHRHDGAHCSACGSGREPTSRYCPDCGTPRPHAIECGACGASFRIPVQVVKKQWRSASLHCERCGEQLPAHS